MQTQFSQQDIICLDVEILLCLSAALHWCFRT